MSKLNLTGEIDLQSKPMIVVLAMLHTRREQLAGLLPVGGPPRGSDAERTAYQRLVEQLQAEVARRNSLAAASSAEPCNDARGAITADEADKVARLRTRLADVSDRVERIAGLIDDAESVTDKFIPTMPGWCIVEADCLPGEDPDVTCTVKDVAAWFVSDDALVPVVFDGDELRPVNTDDDEGYAVVRIIGPSEPRPEPSDMIKWAKEHWKVRAFIRNTTGGAP